MSATLTFMCCASRIKSPALSSSTLLERSRESAAKPTKPMQVTNRQTATAAGTGRMCGTIRAVGTSTRQKAQIGLKRRQISLWAIAGYANCRKRADQSVANRVREQRRTGCSFPEAVLKKEVSVLKTLLCISIY